MSTNSFLEHAIHNPPARDLMRTKLITLKPDMDVFKAVEILVKNKISGAPVVDDDNRLLGTFSEKSVMRVLVVAAYEQVPTNRIDAFMEKEPCIIDETTQLVTMAQLFLNKHCRRLPVVRDGILVGQVSRRDIIAAALRMVEKGHHENHLLYLSALRDMADAPNV